MFDLTRGQHQLRENVIEWYKNAQSQEYVYSGPAGTGKTSVLPYIISSLNLDSDEVLYVTYTGKAATVLMQKGFPAQTIHSAFYDMKEVPLIVEGQPVYKNGRVVKKPRFVPKEFISEKIKLIVLDEWSMVNEEFAKTIYKFGVPILASGDKYQLPPIMGTSPFSDKIQFNLTEITRQAEHSGIVVLATMIREGKELPIYQNFFNTAYLMDKKMVRERHLLTADIILTGKNKTRTIFNEKVRSLHNGNKKLPQVGDKLICRKNNWHMSLDGIPLVNGIIGKCIHPIRMDECNLNKGLYRMDFQPDYAVNDFSYYEALSCDYEYLNQPCGNKEINEWNKGMKLEYAEAISVVLSQGSQYNTVVYWDEWMMDREYMQRLRYTAVTRAIKKVYMFV